MKKFVENIWNQDIFKFNILMGVEWIDEFLMKVFEFIGKLIFELLVKECGCCMDFIFDSYVWLYGKKFVFYGDLDFVFGMVKVLFECGVELIYVLVYNGNKCWVKVVEKLLVFSLFGVNGKVYVGNDLWYMCSLCFMDKLDFLIGNFYGKYIQCDICYKGEEFEVLLICFGFLLFDCYYLYCQIIMGYEGMMFVVIQLINVVFE